MGLESGTYLADLNTANPAGTDAKSQGDDHIRLIKATAKNSFPGFAGIVIATAAETGSGAAYAVALSPAPASYAALANTLVVFKAAHANTGGASLDVNGLGAKPVLSMDGAALQAGDIKNGAMVGVFYDGASFLLITGNDRPSRAGDAYSGAHDFTGATVQVATQAVSDNSTKAASTAYVDGSFAPKASPALTGTPTAPTAAPGTNTTQVATTAFVQQQAFATALPVQAGNGGKFLGTDGTNASWVLALPMVSTNTAGQVITNDGATISWAAAPAAPHVIVQDQRSSGSAGQLLSAASWNDRVLNTVVRNSGGYASLASNLVTLSAGTWLIRARACLVSSTNSSYVGRARLYNNTDATILAQGENVAMNWADDGRPGGVIANVMVVVSFTSPKAVKLQTYSTTTSGGIAVATGDVEVYATFEATRVG